MSEPRSAILVINCGSSSLKFAVFGLTEGLERLVWGAVSGVGTSQGRLQLSNAKGTVEDQHVRFPDHATAIEKVDAVLQQQTSRWRRCTCLHCLCKRHVSSGTLSARQKTLNTEHLK